MSAFILCKKSIDALVYAATARDHDRYDLKHKFVFYSNGARFELTADEFGQRLVDQNYASINDLYRDSKKPYLYQYENHPDFRNLKSVDFLKLCDCYDYQSCETKDYDNSFISDAMFSLRKRLISTLPGYDEAEWGIS